MTETKQCIFPNIFDLNRKVFGLVVSTRKNNTGNKKKNKFMYNLKVHGEQTTNANNDRVT